MRGRGARPPSPRPSSTPLAPARLVLLAGLLAVLGSAGCGALSTPSLVRNYYTLEYVPRYAPPAGSQRPYPFALQVGRFGMERATNRPNIVYRFSPHQLQYYERERWAVRPDDMIREMVFKHLDQARLTSRLAMEYSDRRPDFRLEGMVQALERLDAGDLFFGHLAMTLKLVRIESGDEVWSYGFDQRRRVHSEDMVRTVQTLSDILQSEMNVAVAQLDSLFLAAAAGRPMPASPTSGPAAPGPAASGPSAPGPGASGPGGTGQPGAGPAAAPPADGSQGVDESTFEIIKER